VLFFTLTDILHYGSHSYYLMFSTKLLLSVRR